MRRTLLIFLFIIILEGVSFCQDNGANEDGWITENVDSNGDTGFWPQIGLNSEGEPLIVYITFDQRQIKYVIKAGEDWSFQPSGPNSTMNMGFLSMAQGADYQPRISYAAGDAGADSFVYYAEFTGTVWVPTGATDISTYNDIRFTSIALDADAYAYISYYTDSGGGDLRYAYNWMGFWQTETADSHADTRGKYNSIDVNREGGDYYVSISYWNEQYTPDQKVFYLRKRRDLSWGTPEIVGVDGEDGGNPSSLVLEDDGPGAYIAYYDNTNGDLKFASFNGSYWQIATVDTDFNAGKYLDLFMKDGMPHIAYYCNDDKMKYATRDPQTNEWKLETVDEDVGFYQIGGGFEPSIVLDSEDNVHIAYHNANTKDLMYAYKSSEEPIVDLPQDSEIRVGNNLMDIEDSADSSCRVMYNLSRPQDITIKVYDLSGNLVQTILEKVPKSVGEHGEDIWDGKNLGGVQVNPGIYYIVVEGDSWKDARKVAIIRGSSQDGNK